jgi:hypothetical protein
MEDYNMNATIIKDAKYNGFGWSVDTLETPIAVTVIGVPTPVDPGCVRVKRVDNGEMMTVAEFALEPNPKIAWDQCLSKAQEKSRELLGFLIGEEETGVRLIQDLPRRPD